MPKRKINSLIKLIGLKRENEREPFVLYLGAGCSASSGILTTKKIITHMMNKFNIKEDMNSLNNIKKYIGREAFQLELENLFKNYYPTKGYHFLANLIKKGYFSLIITTNYDHCLEISLSKTIDYNKFKVLIRGDYSDDQINKILSQPLPRIKILKIHGDIFSDNAVVEPNKTWDFNDSLSNTIKNKISNNGIIIIGSSLIESTIFRHMLYDENNKNYFINRSAPKQITENNLMHLGIDNKRIIFGDIGEFDNFFSYLIRNMDYPEFDIIKRDLDELDIKDITKILYEQDIDPTRLYDLVDNLASKISNCSISNLVFIHDPDAPGGTLLLNMIKSMNPKKLLKKNIYICTIQGRLKEELINRRVVDFTSSNGKEILNTERFIIVDSVAFSGRTIKLCRDFLLKKFHKGITIGVACVFISPSFKNEIMYDNINLNSSYLFYEEIVRVPFLRFPWCLVPATQTFIPLKTIEDKIDQFFPQGTFEYSPRPWGSMIYFIKNTFTTVKILHINPRETTSKHVHFIRDEIFYILDGPVNVELYDKVFQVRKGNSIKIPAGCVHRFMGLDVPSKILEISIGYYDQVEDITRQSDKYGRTKEKGII